MTTHRPNRSGGFTLVEMMVALFIFGLLASGAVMLLRFSVDAEAQSRQKLGEIAQIRRFVAVWNADLAQAVPRLARDEDGQKRLAFEYGDSLGDGVFLRLTRGGWSNYSGDPRPSMQKVEYRLNGQRLERRGYEQLDGAWPEDGSLLLDGVSGVTMRLREKRGTWLSDWNPTVAREMPVAAEITVERINAPPIVLSAIVGANYQ
jgi:general secretion pathway protein J